MTTTTVNARTVNHAQVAIRTSATNQTPGTRRDRSGAAELRAGDFLPRSTKREVSVTTARPFQTLAPPPVQALALAYFGPIMDPTPVATRRPQPAVTSDTINGFLRVEAGGGILRGNEMQFDVGVILDAYGPNAQEGYVEQIIANALAWGNNAQGTAIIHPSTGDSYFVSYAKTTALGTKAQDPLVNLVRFRGRLTWRIAGRPL